MITFLIILLGAGIVAGLVLRKQSQAAGNGLLIACGSLGTLLAVASLVSTLKGPQSFASMVSEMEAINQAMAHELGRYLAGQEAGKNALCVLDPLDPNNNAIRVGLEAGLGGALPLAFIELEPKFQDEASDMLQLTPAYLDDLLKGHPDTDLLICMVPIPFQHAGSVAGILNQRKVRLATGADSVPELVLGGFRKAGVFAGGAVFRDDPVSVKSVKKASPSELFEANYVLVPAQGG